MGRAVPSDSAYMAPPTPATKAAMPETMTFICRTLSPIVRAPTGLQRTAFNASPAVDFCTLSTSSAATAKTPRDR